MALLVSTTMKKKMEMTEHWKQRISYKIGRGQKEEEQTVYEKQI